MVIGNKMRRVKLIVRTYRLAMMMFSLLFAQMFFAISMNE